MQLMMSTFAACDELMQSCVARTGALEARGARAAQDAPSASLQRARLTCIPAALCVHTHVTSVREALCRRLPIGALPTLADPLADPFGQGEASFIPKELTAAIE